MKLQSNVLRALFFLIGLSYDNLYAAMTKENAGLYYEKWCKVDIKNIAQAKRRGETKTAQSQLEKLESCIRDNKSILDKNGLMEEFLSYAVDCGTPDTIKMLLAAGATIATVAVNRVTFFCCIKRGALDKARAFLEHDYDMVVNQPKHKDSKWGEFLPLGQAVAENSHHVVIFLIMECDADWNLVYKPQWINALELARQHFVASLASPNKRYRNKEKRTVRQFSQAIADRKQGLIAALADVLTRDPANLVIYFCHQTYPSFDFAQQQWISDRAVQEAAEKLAALQISD